MTTFAPTSHPKTEVPHDTPHHHAPPPQHSQHGPFSHQLAASLTSSNPQVSRRASRDLRHHGSNGAMAGPNGNGPMAVPGGRMGNGNGNRDMAFGGPRSPPNNKSGCR